MTRDRDPDSIDFSRRAAPRQELPETPAPREAEPKAPAPAERTRPETPAPTNVPVWAYPAAFIALVLFLALGRGDATGGASPSSLHGFSAAVDPAAPLPELVPRLDAEPPPVEVPPEPTSRLGSSEPTRLAAVNESLADTSLPSVSAAAPESSLESEESPMVRIAQAFAAGRNDEACGLVQDATYLHLADSAGKVPYCMALYDLARRYMREGLGRNSFDDDAVAFFACAWKAASPAVPIDAHAYTDLNYLDDCSVVCLELADQIARSSGDAPWSTPISCGAQRSAEDAIEKNHISILSVKEPDPYGNLSSEASRDVTVCMRRVTKPRYQFEDCP